MYLLQSTYDHKLILIIFRRGFLNVAPGFFCNFRRYLVWKFVDLLHKGMLGSLPLLWHLMYLLNLLILELKQFPCLID